MKVLHCKKVQCPLMCFCNPSAANIYTSAPLKLENSPHTVPSAACAVSDKSSSGAEEENGGANNREFEGDESVVELRSCIRKVSSSRPGPKRVQWMDVLGKELAEVKEFESSETEDTDNEDENSRCLCVIL